MLKKYQLDIVCCSILLILIIIFIGKTIFNPDGGFLCGVDIIGYSYWNILFTKEMLRSGILPLWNPYIYSGHPFLADPANFIFYPITILYVIMPIAWAINLDILLHVIIASLGTYFFVKLITQSRYAGLASAIVYGLSGYFIWRIYQGHLLIIHFMSLTPWIFYCIEKALTSNRIIYIFISGIILGLQILSAGPGQGTIYTSIFLTLYFFLRWFAISKHSEFKHLYRAFGWYTLIPVVSFGISAIQILPTLEFAKLSQRSMNTYEFCTFMSFHPLQFFNFIVPFWGSPTIPLIAELGGYIGILSIILAIIGGAFSKHKQYTIPLVIMLLVALTFMFGKYTPIYYIYWKFLPFFSLFRIPGRCIVMFVFLLAILVGFGLQHLLESGLNKYQRYLVQSCLAIIASCIFIAISFYQNLGVIMPKVPLASTSIGYALLFTFVALVVLSAFHHIHNKHIAAGLLITILFFDLFITFSPLIPELKETDIAQENDLEHIIMSDKSFFRVNMPGDGPEGMYPLWGLPNHAIKFHYYGINGHTPLILRDYFEFIYSMADTPPPDQNRHTFSKELFYSEKVFSSKILGVKYAVASTPQGFLSLTAKETQPHAILIRNVKFAAKDDQLNFLKQSNFDTRKIVLLDESDRNYVLMNNTNTGSSDQDKVVFANYAPNRLDLISDSPSSTMLLLSELYCPGWKASVDGKDVPILRADYLLRAVKLDAGKHSITMVYQPSSFYIGSGITILTCLLLMVFYLYPKKKKGPKEAAIKYCTE